MSVNLGEQQQLISVVMPVYNRQKLIVESINSVLAQTYRNFELIIVDDGSTDDTLSMLKKMARKDTRIHLIRQNNAGAGAARNAALRVAKGEFIAIADSDDVSNPKRFEKQIAVMNSNPNIIVCGSSYTELSLDGMTGRTIEVALTSAAIKLDLYVRCPFGHSTCMIRASEIKAIGGYKNILYAEDYDTWIRLSDKGDFYNIQESLCNYRVHSISLSGEHAKHNKDPLVSLKNGLWINPPKIAKVLEVALDPENYRNNRLVHLIDELHYDAKKRNHLYLAFVLMCIYVFVKVKIRLND